MANALLLVHLRMFYRTLRDVFEGSNPYIAVLHNIKSGHRPPVSASLVSASCTGLESPYDARRCIEVSRHEHTSYYGPAAIVVRSGEGQNPWPDFVVGAADAECARRAVAEVLRLDWDTNVFVMSTRLFGIDDVLFEAIAAYETPVLAAHLLDHERCRWARMMRVAEENPLWVVEPKMSEHHCPLCGRPLPEFPFRPMCRCGADFETEEIEWLHPDNARRVWLEAVRKWIAKRQEVVDRGRQEAIDAMFPRNREEAENQEKEVAE